MKIFAKLLLSVVVITTATCIASAQQVPVQDAVLRRADQKKNDGQNHFTLNGKVPQGLNGQKAFLVIYGNYSDDKREKSYSAIIHDNSFSFTGAMEKPSELATINIFNEKNTLTGHLNIILDAKVNQLVATAPAPHDKFFKNKLSHAILLNSKANYIKHLIDSMQVADKGENNAEQMRILAQYPDEYYSLLRLYQIASSHAMKDEREDIPLKIFGSFSPALKSSALGKQFFKEITAARNARELSRTGSQVPEFSINTDKGQLFNTASLKGSPYIIGFSATWCMPCQFTQVKLLALYHKYRSAGLKVVYFDLDNSANTWHEHIKKNKLDWINLSELAKAGEDKISKQFDVNGIPLYILVDRQGKIVYNAAELNDFRSDHLEEYIKKVL